jgi:hypothetical protein
LAAHIQYSEVTTNADWAPGSNRFERVVVVRTNLDLAVRLQIPKGEGMLLLNQRTAGAARDMMAVLIAPR